MNKEEIIELVNSHRLLDSKLELLGTQVITTDLRNLPGIISAFNRDNKINEILDININTEESIKDYIKNKMDFYDKIVIINPLILPQKEMVFDGKNEYAYAVIDNYDSINFIGYFKLD